MAEKLDLVLEQSWITFGAGRVKLIVRAKLDNVQELEIVRLLELPLLSFLVCPWAVEGRRN